MSILIENVTKYFGKNIVLDGINLEIKTGSLVALLGGSGSGKSTLLRVVAGFEEPTHGRVWLNGKDSNLLSIQEKEIGFVFQAYALFQHLTVYENIAFGLSCNSSQLGLSNLKNNFYRYSSFIFSFFNSCQHTLIKFLDLKKYNNSNFFFVLKKVNKKDGENLMDHHKINNAKHLTRFSKTQFPIIANKEQKLGIRPNLKTTHLDIVSDYGKQKPLSFNVIDPKKKIVNNENPINKFKSHQSATNHRKRISPLSTFDISNVNNNNSLPNGHQRSVEELLRIVGLEELAHRYPNQLSGGQCQRVALARALAIQPKVLLLDEPFGALDTKVRKNLRRWLRQLHERVGVTTLFVTHDHQEAMEVASEIVVLDKGRVLHSLNSPQKIFSRLTPPTY